MKNMKMKHEMNGNQWKSHGNELRVASVFSLELKRLRPQLFAGTEKPRCHPVAPEEALHGSRMRKRPM